MRLAEVVSTSAAVTDAAGRRDKVELLAALLRRLRGRELEVATDYLSGRLPQGRIGVGWASLRRALPELHPSEPGLDLIEVDRRLEDLASRAGTGAGSRRLDDLGALLARATQQEADFLARVLIGEVRQGALEGVMVAAVAKAAGVAQARVRRALMLTGDLGRVARLAGDGGEPALAAVGLEMFRPIQPMLAQPAEDLAAGLDRHGTSALEYKLDGARVQVHRVGGDVRVFSRRLHDVTASVPELVAAALSLPVREVLLDGEALVLRADGRPEAFQTTMRRFGRRLDVAAMAAELPLSVFFFDCLRVDGEDLLDRPGEERFAALAGAVAPESLVPRLVTTDVAAAEGFFERAIAAGHEGVMAKQPAATYEAGSRGRSWLKIKRAHTLDLVVLAAEWGHGRRRGKLSNLHLGARGAGGFVMLGKTFKGLTDAMLEEQTRRLLELETSREGRVVHVAPRLVVEVAFDGVQESPQYPGGLALRFARVRGYRLDKSAAEADSFEAVQAIWAGQG